MRKRSISETFDNFFEWMETYRAVLRKVRASSELTSLGERKEVFEAFVPKIHALGEVAATWRALSRPRRRASLLKK